MATRPSHNPAPDVIVTVAPFRAWRSSQLIVARGPEQAAIEGRLYSGKYRVASGQGKLVASFEWQGKSRTMEHYPLLSHKLPLPLGEGWGEGVKI